MLTVSRQLLVQQTGPELDRILISDLSRQLDSFLDQVALYGTGPSGNQPLGLVGVPGVSQGFAISATDPHNSFCALEAQIEAANASMDSYGVLLFMGSRHRTGPTPTARSRSRSLHRDVNFRQSYWT
jgi:hypothetical protein